MVAGDAGRVKLVGALEREGVEPEGNAIQDGSGRVVIGLDRQQISHLALGGSRLRWCFQSGAGGHAAAPTRGSQRAREAFRSCCRPPLILRLARPDPELFRWRCASSASATRRSPSA